MEGGRQDGQGPVATAQGSGRGSGPIGWAASAEVHVDRERSLPPRPLRPQPPVGQLLGGHGRPGAHGRRAAGGRSSRPRSRSSAAATPASRRPTISRGSTASRRSCSRPGRSAGALPGATAASAASAAARSAMAAWRSAWACRRPPASSRPRRPAWRWSATSPPRRRSTSSPRARASTTSPTGPAAGTSSRTAGTVQRLFGERWPLWRKAEMEERLLRSPEAHGCLVVPHYFGLHPLRYVRGLAQAAVRRGAAIHAATPVTAWQRGRRRHAS